MSKDIFMEIVKQGLTFTTPRGQMLPQDVFKLPLSGSSGCDLDVVSKLLLTEMRAQQEESLVTTTTPKNAANELRKEVLMAIIADRRAEAEAAAQRRENREHNAKIAAAIEQAENKELAGKSVEELRKLYR